MANTLVYVINGEEAPEFVITTGRLKEMHALKINPELILLNVQMPKVNGLEVLERIKSDAKTKIIPVVILTSSKELPVLRNVTILV
jgi:two-component system response regulator